MGIAIGVAALLAAGCATTGPHALTCPARGGAPWLQLTSAHFVLSTDQDEPEARRIATTLEDMFEAIGTVGLASPRGPRGQLNVIHFRTRDAYDQFGPTQSGAYFQRNGRHDRERLPVAVVQGDLASRTREIIKHELTHAFIRHHFPQAPSWLNEGLAQYISTLEVSQGLAVLGRPPAEGRFWRGPWKSSHDPTGVTLLIPMSRAPTVADLLKMNGEVFHAGLGLDPDTAAGQEAGRNQMANYAGAWTLVHLLISHPTYREPFNEYLQAMRTNQDARQAWASTVGKLSPDQLEADYRAALVPPEFQLLRTRYSPPPTTAPTVRPLTDGEVHLLWASLRPWRDAQDRALAEADLREAASDPTVAPALATMKAELAYTAKNSAEATRLLADAAAAFPSDPRVLNAYGWQLLLDGAGAPAARPTTGPVLLRLAARLRPLAQTAAEMDLLARLRRIAGDRDGALADEARAVVVDPGCFQCFAVAAALFAEKGDLASAVAVAEKALSILPDGVSLPALSAELAKYRRQLAAGGSPSTP